MNGIVVDKYPEASGMMDHYHRLNRVYRTKEWNE